MPDTEHRPTKQIDVVGAVVLSDGMILCTQRGTGGSSEVAGKWEFPGGKIERGESPSKALTREIEEELGCQIVVGEKVVTTVHEYEFGVVTLTTFYCDLAEGSPELSEHQAMQWLQPAELHRLDWAPADIPAVQAIQTKFGPGA